MKLPENEEGCDDRYNGGDNDRNEVRFPQRDGRKQEILDEFVQRHKDQGRQPNHCEGWSGGKMPRAWRTLAKTALSAGVKHKEVPWGDRARKKITF